MRAFCLLRHFLNVLNGMFLKKHSKKSPWRKRGEPSSFPLGGSQTAILKDWEGEVPGSPGSSPFSGFIFRTKFSAFDDDAVLSVVFLWKL